LYDIMVTKSVTRQNLWYCAVAH